MEIKNKEYAKQMLCSFGYFSIINGYRQPFINPSTKRYINNASFEEIFKLFKFDEQLRRLFFHYICTVEKSIRSQLSYAFCETYGEDQSNYLRVSHYHSTPSNHKDLIKLIKILDFKANIDTNHEYVNYKRRKYNNVPLWILIHTISFGNLSKMYELSKPSIRSKVASNYKNINDSDLEKILKNLVLYRNVCGHHERLYSHKIYTDFPDTILHKKLKIPKKGQQYIYGKRDLFGVVISLRYLLSEKDFKLFKRELTLLIKAFLNNNPKIQERWLTNEMGFPSNWSHIMRYKI